MVDAIPFTDIYQAGRFQATDIPGDRITLGANLDFTGGSETSYSLDINLRNQQLVFGKLKTVYIDNGDGINEVVVKVSQTLHKFACPAGAQGFFIISGDDTSRLEISSSGSATAFTNILFFNYDLPPIVWYKLGSPTNVTNVVSVQGANSPGTDMDTATDTNPFPIAGVQDDGILRYLKTNASRELSINVADGSDVTQGAKADAAVTNPATAASIVAILKGLLTLLGFSVTLGSGQVAITVSAQLVAARATKRKVTITNGAVAAFIGPAGVTVANGLALAANQTVEIETSAAIHAISSGGSTTMSYLEAY